MPNSEVELPPLQMKGMIQNGVYSQNTIVQDLQPACSSANCTWSSYRSLAVCARSADVTKSLKSELVKVPGEYRDSPKKTVSKWYLSEHNYLLDNGYNVFSISTVAKPWQSLVDLTSHPDFSDSIAFKNISVTNGNSSTERHNSFSNFSFGESFEDQTARPDDGDDREYDIEYGTHHILRNYFFVLLNGTAAQMNVAGESATPVFTNDAVQALYQPVSVIGVLIDGKDDVPGRGEGQVGLQRILDNLATGMTNL